VQVQVSAKRLSFPPTCPCCGLQANTQVAITATRTTGKRVIHTTERSWTFPYCSSCLRHVAVWDAAASWMILTALGAMFAIFSSVAYGLLARLVPGEYTGLGVVGGIGGIVLGIWRFTRKRAEARKMCTSQCVVPARAVSYLGWYGTIQTFAFSSHAYAVTFAQANRSKLVNVSPELRRHLP